MTNLSNLSMEDLKKHWAKDAAKHLVGRKIVKVRYLKEDETEDLMWSNAPLIIFFDDGSYIYPSSDDEGNDGGALFTSHSDLSVIPVI